METKGQLAAAVHPGATTAIVPASATAAPPWAVAAARRGTVAAAVAVLVARVDHRAVGVEVAVAVRAATGANGA